MNNENGGSADSVSPFQSQSLRTIDMDEDLRDQILDALMEGRTIHVAELCEKASRVQDAPVELLFHAGKHRLAEGLAEQAHALLTEALRREPRFSAAHRVMGEACLRMGAYLEAIDHLTACTQLDNDDFAAWALLALVNDLCNRREATLAALSQAISAYPQDRYLLRKLAHQLAKGKI